MSVGASTNGNGNGFSKKAQDALGIIVASILIFVGGSVITLLISQGRFDERMKAVETAAQSIVPIKQHEQHDADIEKRFEALEREGTDMRQIIYSNVFGTGKKADAKDGQHAQ